MTECSIPPEVFLWKKFVRDFVQSKGKGCEVVNKNTFVMAEGFPQNTTWSSQIRCRYYLHGVCRQGDQCPYSHDLGSKPDNVCRFYLKGACSYKDKCRYQHVKQDHTTSSSPNKAPKPLVLASKDRGGGGRLVTLRKKDQSADSGYGEDAGDCCSGGSPEITSTPGGKKPEEWVKAAEFIPGQMWRGATPSSYSGATQSGLEYSSGPPVSTSTPQDPPGSHYPELCPYASHGECWYGENCAYRHGDICDFCGKAKLDPLDHEQQKLHIEECIKQHEEDMELSFQIAQSRDKVCGICMENVSDKKPVSEARFGILSECNHVFCLACIRKWRSAKNFENKIVRACPECRIKSDFVTPSKYWIEGKEEKMKLIEGYKKALSERPCKYFDQGKGECPFNNNCFYKHAYPDGRIASPVPVQRRRRLHHTGEIDIIPSILIRDFWDHLNNRRDLLAQLDEEIQALLVQAELYGSSSDSDSDFDSDFDGFI